MIVVPNFEQDVSFIIRAARANNMELSIRSGGHSYTCTNIKEGGVHMDMRWGTIIDIRITMEYVQDIQQDGDGRHGNQSDW